MPQISLIYLKDIQKAGRIDAEYFKPEYLKTFLQISKLETVKLQKIAKVSDGDHSKFPENQKNEIRYLRSKDIKGNFLVEEDPVYVSTKYFELHKRSHVTELNILISIMGNIGDTTITPKGYKPSLANRAICIIKEVTINPYYLYAYFTTKMANNNIQKIKNGGIQERINLQVLNEVLIPILSQSFQLQVEEIVKLAHTKQTQSKQLYKEAEDLLLEELGLVDYEVKHTLSFLISKSQVETANSFDSEYFQPKYEEIIKKVESYEGGWDYLKGAINFKDKSFNPKVDQIYKYLALSNISSQGYIQDYQEEKGQNLPSRARRIVNTNDLIISTIEGSFSSLAIIEEEFNNAICSTGFFVLNSNEINSETLLVLFKSLVTQELLKRGSKGTILTAISKTELEYIKIPLLKIEIQKQIAEKVQESHKLRKESKELLEKAKKMVEDEIEKA